MRSRATVAQKDWEPSNRSNAKTRRNKTGAWLVRTLLCLCATFAATGEDAPSGEEERARMEDARRAEAERALREQVAREAKVEHQQIASLDAATVNYLVAMKESVTATFHKTSSSRSKCIYPTDK